MQLDPTGSTSHGLSPVLGAPAFDEAHSDGAHSCQLVHGLEALVDRLGQQCSELLVIENLQVAAWWDLADSGRVPAIALVAVGRLNEDGAVTEALGENFSSNVVQPHASTDVPPG